MFKNFKKIALSLLVVGLALTIQSFKNVEEKKSAGEIVYLLNAAGDTYTRFSDDGSLPSEGGCTHVEEYEACIQQFDLADDPGSTVITFPANNIPANNIPGTPEAYWEF